MIIFRLLGAVLLLAAFVAGAFEIATHGIADEKRGFLSAWQVLFVHAPDELLKARLFVEERFGAALWDNGIYRLLALPGWLILGAPGALFMWLSLRGAKSAAEREEDASEEDSLYLYDALERAAKEDGFYEAETDIYTDAAGDIHASWKDEEQNEDSPTPDRHDAKPPHRPAPPPLGR